MTQEIWESIPGFSGYEVSNHGRVRSYRRPGGGRLALNPQRILKSRLSGQYLLVHLMKNGIIHTQRVAHLVLAAFVGPRPPGMEVCHNDCNPINNNLNNLRYDTPANNRRDGCGSYAKVRLTNLQAHQIRQAAQEGIADEELARRYGVSTNVIVGCRVGRFYRYADGPITKYKQGSTPGISLTELEIITMRQERHEQGKSIKELAAKYSIHESNVSRIVRGLQYPHIGGPISNRQIP